MLQPQGVEQIGSEQQPASAQNYAQSVYMYMHILIFVVSLRYTIMSFFVNSLSQERCVPFP